MVDLSFLGKCQSKFGDNYRLAKDLILRLCQVNIDYRYTASTALQHPWITGDVNADIPISIYETNIRKSTIESLSKVVRAVFFLVICGGVIFNINIRKKTQVLTLNKLKIVPLQTGLNLDSYIKEKHHFR